MSHFVKVFGYEESKRPQLTFSDATKIRLNPSNHRLELKSQGFHRTKGGFKYPVDTDLTVTTWVSNPSDARQILGFESEPLASIQRPSGTSVFYRISDGTQEYYWDGAQWAVAGATDWNTEAELATNLSAFAFAARKIGFVINLRTTDNTVTPSVASNSILLDVEGDPIFDLLGKSLTQGLQNSFRVVKELAFNDVGGLRISLLDLETPFDIDEILAVYNHTTDPGHATDLYSSYDTEGDSILCTAAFSPGDIAWVRMKTSPKVYLNWGSQDYTEVEKIPAVVIDSIGMRSLLQEATAEVRNFGASTAKIQRRPFRATFTIGIVLLAESSATLLRMLTSGQKFIADNPLLTTVGLDEQYTLMGNPLTDYRPRPSLSDKRNAEFSMTIKDFYMWLTDAEEKTLVQRFLTQYTDVSHFTSESGGIVS